MGRGTLTSGIQRFEDIVLPLGGFPRRVEPRDVLFVGGVIALLHHFPKVGVPLAVVLQRERPKRLHFVHVAFLPDAER